MRKKRHLSDVQIKEAKDCCPQCGKGPLDGFATTTDDPGKVIKPRVGDITICIQCLTFLVITEGFHLRKATTAEIFQAHLDNPELIAAVEHVRRNR